MNFVVPGIISGFFREVNGGFNGGEVKRIFPGERGEGKQIGEQSVVRRAWNGNCIDLMDVWRAGGTGWVGDIESVGVGGNAKVKVDAGRGWIGREGVPNEDVGVVVVTRHTQGCRGFDFFFASPRGVEGLGQRRGFATYG